MNINAIKLSWVKNAVTDIATAAGHNSFAVTLVANHVEPVIAAEFINVIDRAKDGTTHDLVCELTEQKVNRTLDRVTSIDKRIISNMCSTYTGAVPPLFKELKMSGLASDTYCNEQEVELSWVMQAITELADSLHINSYHICLIRHKLNPRTVEAFEKSLLSLGYYKHPHNIDLELLKTEMGGRDKNADIPSDAVLEEIVKTHLTMLKLAAPSS